MIQSYLSLSIMHEELLDLTKYHLDTLVFILLLQLFQYHQILKQKFCYFIQIEFMQENKY